MRRLSDGPWQLSASSFWSEFTCMAYIRTDCENGSAMETFTREEIDSAFIEDQQLRDELDNINLILDESDDKIDFSEIKVNPAMESDLTPVHIPGPSAYIPTLISAISEEYLISYMLRHADHRLITSDEIEEAARQSGFELDQDSYFVFHQDGEGLFRIASLSEPGDFSSLGTMEFSCLGFNFFIDLTTSGNHRHGYEVMLKKIDELVRLMGLKCISMKHNY